MFKNLKFTTKLYLSVGISLVLVVAILTYFATFTAKKKTIQLVESAVANVDKQLANSFKGVLRRTSSANHLYLFFLKEKLNDKEPSLFHLDKSNSRQLTIVNQKNGQSEQVSLPVLASGSLVIDQQACSFLDQIKHRLSAKLTQLTIFQVAPGKLVRMATTIVKPDGSRAVYTYIPADSPIYQTVMQGKPYEETTFIFKQLYLTLYEPVLDSNGKVIAVLFAGRPVFDSILRQELKETHIKGHGYPFVYTDQGLLVYHPTLVGKNVFQVPKVGALFKSASSGSLVSYLWKGKHKISYVTHLDQYKLWIGFGVAREALTGPIVSSIVSNNVGAGIILACLGIGGVLLVIFNLSRQLKRFAQKAKLVAQGDYNVHFDYSAQDALGVLAESLNLVVKNTRQVVQDVLKESKRLVQNSEELTHISEESSTLSVQLKEKASSTHSSLEQMAGSTSEVVSTMEELASNATTIASAAEEMSNTIAEIAQNTQKAQEITSTGVNKVEVISEKVNELGGAAAEITSVTETIATISAQTNLLALNATIEAARAGEAGKGFAVVATEIKELAKQTGDATEEIKRKIEAMQNATDTTVSQVKEITEVIQDINQIVTTIAAAIEEQSVTTRDIAANVGNISSGVEVTKNKVIEVSEEVNGVERDIEEVQESSEKLATSSTELREQANALKSLSSRLQQLLTRFKV